MRFFHDITAFTLSWSEAFDLTRVGLNFGHPQLPYRLGMALIPPLFSDRPFLQNGPFGSESSALFLLKCMLDVNGQLDTLWSKNKLLSS